MTEPELLKRLGVDASALVAFHVPGGIKEFLRQRLQQHGAMNIAHSENGKCVRYHEVFEQVYGETLEGRKRASKSKA